MESESLGAKFWVYLLGGTVLALIGAFVLFALFGMAWYAWGGFAAICVGMGLLALVAWIKDKSDQRKYEKLDAELDAGS